MSTSTTESPLQSSALQAGVAVVSGGTVGVVAQVLFELPVFAVAVGALSAIGSVFLLQWLASAADAGDHRNAAGTLHRGAAGMALEGGAVVAIAVMFVLESAPVALGGGLGLAAVEFLVLSQFLPEVPEAADETV